MSEEEDNYKQVQLNTMETNLLPDISSFMEDEREESISFGYYKKKNGDLNPQFSVSNIQDQNLSNVDKTIVNLFPEVPTDSLPSFDFGERKQILFRPIQPDTIWNNRKESFIYIRCQLLTTFFYYLTAYSQFSNPNLIENDPRFELKFLYRGNNLEYDGELFSLLPSFSLNNISNKQLEPFISALNVISASEKFLSIRRKNSQLRLRANIIFYSLLVFFICLTIGFIVYLILALNKITFVFWIVMGLYVVFFFALLYFMYIYKKQYKNSKFILIEQTVSHRIKNSLVIEKFISEWNRKLFFPNKMVMWAPISLDYVMFNLCQEHDIQLKHHSIDSYKEKEYK